MAIVTIYSKWGCGYCMWARRLLDRRGIEWEEIHVTFKPAKFQEMVQRSGGRTTAPQIFFGDYHVGGYRELVELDEQGRLPALLAAAERQAADERHAAPESETPEKETVT
jgi:glutaredoxin 3